MTPLAIEIYKLLVRRLRAGKASMTYIELAQQISAKIPTHQRSPKLHAALGEISVACRAGNLPCVPAIVWRQDTRRPGAAYFRYAHPRTRSPSGQVTAWEAEHARVLAEVARLPRTLRNANHPERGRDERAAS